MEIVEENPAVNKCLKKVADAMYSRLISEFHSTRVRDFSKNIKTLSAKYFYHEPLFSAFCRIVERDIDENCYCSKERFRFTCNFSIIFKYHTILKYSTQVFQEYLRQNMQSARFLRIGRCPRRHLTD